jgi:pSer/pThr/pTyr-binding forkhead associated (FHA) protein
VCRNGHANPPDGTACRVCAEPLAGPTRTVARPPLGAIAVSTGERYVLDRSTIVGRRPRASRVSVHDVPQLVTVPSPQQDISRSHLELRLEGWHVVALDLGTTNGTTLHRPGHEPLRLRAREGVLLRDGDLLDLGDDVHLTYGEKA